MSAFPVRRADATAYKDVAVIRGIVVVRRGRRSMRLKGELFIVELIGDLTYYRNQQQHYGRRRRSSDYVVSRPDECMCRSVQVHVARTCTCVFAAN